MVTGIEYDELDGAQLGNPNNAWTRPYATSNRPIIILSQKAAWSQRVTAAASKLCRMKFLMVFDYLSLATSAGFNYQNMTNLTESRLVAATVDPSSVPLGQAGSTQIAVL